jgi:hypothetical protein
MASIERPISNESDAAGADLRTKQYYAVDLNTVAWTVVLGNGKAIGVLQNKPNTGEAATVMTDGYSQMVVDAGTDIIPGDYVGVDGNGKGIKVTADKAFYLGRARTGATADGDRITIKVNPGYLAA